jgi:deoxyadenosine/deoxycytidine kinase
MIIVEGNIGAGKSTFLKKLAKYSEFVDVAQEPVDSWHKKEDGSNLLENFYKYPHRWAYTLETFAMAARLQEHIKHANNNKPIVVERSIYSGHYCFAKNDYLAGYMTDIEWELYQQWFDTIIASFAKPPRGFIYLKVSPDVALERIKKRNRAGEENISLDYLIEIDKRHQEFLVTKNNILENISSIPVKTFNVDQLALNDQEMETVVKEAIEFIKSLTNKL